MNLDIPLPGLHNIYNATAAIGVALALGYPLDWYRPPSRTFALPSVVWKKSKRAIKLFFSLL